MRRIRTRRGTPSRRGVVILEVILAFVILVLLAVAMVQFTVTGVVSQTVNAAAVDATREAAKTAGVSTDSTDITDRVTAVVNEYLAVHGLSLADDVRADVKFRRAGDASTTTIPIGDTTDVPSCPMPADTFFPAGQGRIAVGVCVLASRNGKPIPNLLSTFGVDVSNRRFESLSQALIE